MDNQNQGGMPGDTNQPAQPAMGGDMGGGMPAGDQGGMPTPPASEPTPAPEAPSEPTPAPEAPAEGGEEHHDPMGGGTPGM